MFFSGVICLRDSLSNKLSNISLSQSKSILTRHEKRWKLFSVLVTALKHLDGR